MLREVGGGLDPTRTHFLGKLPYADYKRVLKVSSAHAYLTYPFVLSWSCLEAMACGCLMVAAEIAPVREVLRHGDNGWLVPPLDSAAVAARIGSAISCKLDQRLLRVQARQSVVGMTHRSGVLRFDASVEATEGGDLPDVRIQSQGLPGNSQAKRLEGALEFVA